MPSIFRTGRLSFPMWLMINTNNLLALVVGNATNAGAMKSRGREGYEARFSDHVERYAEPGPSDGKRIAAGTWLPANKQRAENLRAV
jgi:hypothetical protein